MKNNRNMPIPLLIIISTGISMICLLTINDEGDIGMNIQSIVAIVVALIGVGSGVWVQVLQFKKDSGSFSSVKADTSGMRPEVHIILGDVESIERDITRRVLPGMEKLNGVDELVDELHYQKRKKAETSGDVLAQDASIAELQHLYEKIAGLEQSISQEKAKNRKLEIENIKLLTALNRKGEPKQNYNRTNDDFDLSR